MAQAKVNGKTILILGAATTGLSVGIGLNTSGLLNYFGYAVTLPDAAAICSATWTIIHVPVAGVAITALRRALGEKAAASISVSTSEDGRTGRKIPFTSASGTRHIFASIMPSVGTKGADRNILPSIVETVNHFAVSIDDNNHTVLPIEIEDFYKASWRRQNNGNAGLSRPFHTRQRRPRLHRTRYEAIVFLLTNAGLVVDRGGRRSGRLVIPPRPAMKILTRLHVPG